MEARYAELQSLHSAVLEEKRQLAASRGRPSRASAATNGATSGEGGAGLERQLVERELRARYEDRITELEEAVEASSSIKKSLQAEASRAAASLAESR